MRLCGQREADAELVHRAGLEFCQINIQGSIKSGGSSDGEQNLADTVIKISVRWMFNIEVSTPDNIDNFSVYHEGTECSRVMSVVMMGM
jgi:hypothetical protein